MRSSFCKLSVKSAFNLCPLISENDLRTFPLLPLWDFDFKSRIVPKFTLVIGSRGKFGMTKGLDMSSCLLLSSYVSIAARKRGRLTKVAGECDLWGWRMRGACQFGPDLPSGATNNVSCTWPRAHPSAQKFQRGFCYGIAEWNWTSSCFIRTILYFMSNSCLTAKQYLALSQGLNTRTKVQTLVRGLFMPLFPISLLAVAYYVT